MSFIQLPANPTREQLRDAQTMLKGLAAIQVPGADAELKAVETLMRTLYPRGAKAAPGTRKRRRRRRTIIEAYDAVHTCEMCDGHGILNPVRRDGKVFEQHNPYHQAGTRRRPFHRGWIHRVNERDRRTGLTFIQRRELCRWRRWRPQVQQTALERHLLHPVADQPYRTPMPGLFVAPLAWATVTCPRCTGKGHVGGAAEHDPHDTHCIDAKGRPVMIAGHTGKQNGAERPMRGERALEVGCSDYHRPTPEGHRRGWLPAKDAPGHVQHVRSFTARRVMFDWAGRLKQADPVDLIAELEARAIDAMRSDELLPPRGRRLVGSRRDKRNLTPGQQPRAKAERRLPRYQAEVNAQQRRVRGTHRRRPSLSVVDEALLACGIDPKAWHKAMRDQAPALVGNDSDRLREARRRGDLPPDDALPDWNEEQAITLRDGRRVQVEGVLEAAAHVVRGEAVQRVVGAVQVRTEDGTLDLVHPAEMP